MPTLSLVLYVLIRSPADSVGFASARLLPGPRANRLRHLGATIGAQDGVRWAVGRPEVERNSNKPPCCLPQSAFLPPCWMTEDWIVKDLICKVYRRYPEHFSEQIRFFSLMQGGRSKTPSEEAALTGGRSALKRCDRFSLAPAANRMSPRSRN